MRAMRLEFLQPGKPEKIVRTTLYGDQEFSRWELELIHTPIVQRLYDLKQLGFSDRVFPDAVHSRLNHVLGVAEMTSRMTARLELWLDRHAEHTFEYVEESGNVERSKWPVKSITGAELAKRVKQYGPVVRLIGLLHDLTHAAFGHTLEDEVCVFREKHDDPARQSRFFDALVAQLVCLWRIDLGIEEPDPDMLDELTRLKVDEKRVLEWAMEIHAVLGQQESSLLAARMRELESAFALLLHLEFVHESGSDRVPALPSLLVSEVVRKLDPGGQALDLVIHRDAIFLDVVGNTICADLLDYARRDAGNAALRVQFDDRLIRYLCAVSVSDDLSPTGRPCIRLAVQFFTDKLRHDVLSEMSGILKARYVINERVLFHPTKCAAGAMLGTAVQLLGIEQLEDWMQVLGDQQFLQVLTSLAVKLSRVLQDPSSAPGFDSGSQVEQLAAACLARLRSASSGEDDPKARVRGARNLLWRLGSRRYPKPIYRVRSGVHHSGGQSQDGVARKYTDRQARFDLEREVEKECNLPAGSLVIHCPKPKTSMKIAQALVVGSDPTRVAHLRDVDKVTSEPLTPYRDEIRAVEEMYKAIWQLHAFLDTAHLSKRSLVARLLAERIEFPNDGWITASDKSATDANSYTLLATELQGEFAWKYLRHVVTRLDQEGAARMRHGVPETERERTLRIIRQVQAEAGPGVQESDTNQLGLSLDGPKSRDEH